MKRIITYLFFSFFLLAQNLLFAESSHDQFMRSNGKIYVVIGVLISIFIGFVIFMVIMERRLKKLEKELNENG